jgi:hypothetical protein
VTVIVQFRLTDDRFLWWVLLAAVVVQVVIAIVWAPSSTGYVQWWNLLTR